MEGKKKIITTEEKTIIGNKISFWEKNKAINLIVLAGAIILALFSLWTFSLRPVRVETFEVNFSVGATTGINIDTDKLYFGRIIPGNSAERTLVIQNEYGFPVNIKPRVTSNLLRYILVEENIGIEPGMTRKIPVNINIPLDTKYGEYSGKIKFYVYRA
jgi:hypothetical protein